MKWKVKAVLNYVMFAVELHPSLKHAHTKSMKQNKTVCMQFAFASHVSGGLTRVGLKVHHPIGDDRKEHCLRQQIGHLHQHLRIQSILYKHAQKALL